MSNVSVQSGWWQWYRELRFLDFGILLTCLSLSPISNDHQQDSTLWRDNDAKQQHEATTDQVHNNNRKQEDKRPQDVMQKRRMLGEVAIEDHAKDR